MQIKKFKIVKYQKIKLMLFKKVNLDMFNEKFLRPESVKLPL